MFILVLLSFVKSMTTSTSFDSAEAKYTYISVAWNFFVWSSEQFQSWFYDQRL